MIRVHFQPGVLHHEKHDVLIGTKIVAALKAADVPVEASTFMLRGVAHGKLEWSKVGHDHVITWIENEQDNAKNWERTLARKGVTVYKNGKHLDEDEL